uniref:Zinc finger and BTB domain containing 37 n=1 Tax=Gallus gallus TaxID=9031 RepID=A0A8V0Y4J8_CHICK
MLPLTLQGCTPATETAMEKSGNIQLEIPDFSNSVLSHLNQLRMQGRLCDIVVNVQGQAFRAHKVVLAASSPYFRDHMSLNEMSTVSISVIKNPSVFEQLLSFCYTGRICLQLADIISYLTAASFLQMQHIIDKCTQILEGIHFKINVAEVEAELSQTRTKHQERPPESHRVTPNLNRSLSPRHNTLKGSRLGQVSTVLDIRELSPPAESTSPQIIEQSSDVESREPILRINRAGQWYVETGMGDRGGRNDDDVRVLGGVRIKTENLEEWLGTENQPSGEDGSSAEEVTAMVIDTTGHGSMSQETYALGSSGAKVARPTSSEIDRGRNRPCLESAVTWNISGSRKCQSAGSGTTHGSPAFTVPNPSTRRAAWTGTCVCTWASRLSSAACVGRSTPARISWSITSASTRATSPFIATSAARASLSRPSSTSTFARTTRAACLWRGLTAFPPRPPSRPGGRRRRSPPPRRKLSLWGRRHRDLCPLLG